MTKKQTELSEELREAVFEAEGHALDEHGLGKALDGQFPGNGTFYYFRADGGGEHSSDEAPEAFVVHVTHGNVLIGFIRPWRHAAASFPEGLDYTNPACIFLACPRILVKMN